MLRLTAKSTQFGRRTFTSWLIESAGTVPIKRRKDFNDESVDNYGVMEKLMEVRQTSGSTELTHVRVYEGLETWRCDMHVSRRDESLPPNYCSAEDWRWVQSCIP